MTNCKTKTFGLTNVRHYIFRQSRLVIPNNIKRGGISTHKSIDIERHFNLSNRPSILIAKFIYVFST